MNPDNKTPNPSQNQPDYSFIVNQPVGPEQTGSKKRDPKIIVILLLLVVLGFTLIVGLMISSANKNAQQETQTTEDQAVQTFSDEEIANQEDIVLQFISALSKGNIDEAAGLMLNAKDETRQNLQSESESIWKGIDVDSCQLQQSTAKNGPLMSCLDSEGSNIYVSFFMVGSPGEYKVYKYDLRIDFGETESDE